MCFEIEACKPLGRRPPRNRLAMRGTSTVSSVRTVRNKFEILGPCNKRTYSTKTFHFSCRSDYLDDPAADYCGLVLWSYDGKEQWELNGVRCRTGYIYIRKTENIKNLTSYQEQVHGKLYKSLFNKEYDSKLFATGFAYFKREWRFSSSLNSRSHFNQRLISPSQSLQIWTAILRWSMSGGEQNMNVGASFEPSMFPRSTSWIHSTGKFFTHATCKKMLSDLKDRKDMNGVDRIESWLPILARRGQKIDMEASTPSTDYGISDIEFSDDDSLC